MLAVIYLRAPLLHHLPKNMPRRHSTNNRRQPIHVKFSDDDDDEQLVDNVTNDGYSMKRKSQKKDLHEHFETNGNLYNIFESYSKSTTKANLNHSTSTSNLLHADIALAVYDPFSNQHVHSAPQRKISPTNSTLPCGLPPLTDFQLHIRKKLNEHLEDNLEFTKVWKKKKVESSSHTGITDQPAGKH